MKRLFSLIFLTLLAFSASAQETYNSSGRRGNAGRPKHKEGFDPSRVIFGGGLGLSLGDVTRVAISPVVGYRISDRFAAGIGLGYQYVRVKNEVQLYNQTINDYQLYPFKASLFSPSVWARVVINGNFFAHAEFEYDVQTIRYYDYDKDPYSATVNLPVQYKKQYSSPALLIGPGFRQRLGSNSSVVFMALYDVIQDKYSPYAKTLDFRIAFNAGF